MKIESKFLKKTWGWELWFDNSELYCGKLLFVDHNKWSSKGKYHYHKKKTESFFILEGVLQLDFIDESNRPDTQILSPMRTFRLNPGVKHRFTSISETGCKFIEVSTFHSDDDSYRGRLDFETGNWQEDEKRKIVGFTNGCFSLIHAGHIKILREAKKLCDELHVGINSDSSVRELKGPSYPIMSEDQRFEILSAIKYVDHVYIFDETTPLKLIEKIMPDIVVKGGDWAPHQVVGGHIAKVVTIPMVQGISTSSIIKDIYKNCG